MTFCTLYAFSHNLQKEKKSNFCLRVHLSFMFAQLIVLFHINYLFKHLITVGKCPFPKNSPAKNMGKICQFLQLHKVCDKKVFKPKILQNSYTRFIILAARLLSQKKNTQNLRDRTLELPFFFGYKHKTSLKNHLLLAQSVGLPYWFRGNFCASDCFDLPVERISFVFSH